MERVRLANDKDLVIFTENDLKNNVIDDRFSFRSNLKAPKGEIMEDIFNQSFMILYIDEGGTIILKDKTRNLNYETI